MTKDEFSRRLQEDVIRLKAEQKKRSQATYRALSRELRPLKGDTARRVLASLVKVVREPGNFCTGFLVDGYIVTAAHCLPRYPGIDAPVFVPIMGHKRGPAAGLKAMAMSIFADAASDIAILSCHDDHYGSFHHMMAQLRELHLAPRSAMRVDVPMSAHVYTSRGKWVAGHAAIYGPSTTYVSFSRDIPGGTSGSPLVDRFGRVFGVCSLAARINACLRTSGHIYIYYGSKFAFLPNVLPGWFLDEAHNQD